MNNRKVSIFTIALLMIGLVFGVGLATPICYAPEPPYNETDAREFDPDILPWDNETDIIILPPVTPEPITNETDVVIIVTDQDLASIQSQLYNIYDWMMMYDQWMMNSRSSIRELNATLNDTVVNFVVVVDEVYNLLDSYAYLQGQIDTQGMVIDELRQEVAQVNEQIEYLEAKILYTYIAIAVLAVVSGFLYIRKDEVGG